MLARHRCYLLRKKKAAHADGLLYSKRGNELKQFFGDGCDVVSCHA